MDKKFFKSYDEEASAGMPEVFKGMRSRMVALSGWQPGDGALPGVFSRKSKGERCLWSCLWGTSRGLLSPGDWMPLDYLTTGEMLAEATDLIYRDSTNNIVARRLTPLVLDFYLSDVDNPGYWIEQLKDTLRSLRVGYAEYVCHFDMPQSTGAARLMNAIPRPGWITRTEIRERLDAEVTK
jgi:hypothetical protein